MHTYILNRMDEIDENTFVIEEGWAVGENSIFYDEDPLLGKFIPEEENFFDGCWVYWNKEDKKFHNLDIDLLRKYDTSYNKAMNSGDIAYIDKARKMYYKYLDKPVILSGEAETEYVKKHRGY